jgi:hypothetical protein
MSDVIAGIRIPDSKLAREATDLLREHGTALLFAHSLRVYFFGAIRGRHRGPTLDQTNKWCQSIIPGNKSCRPSRHQDSGIQTHENGTAVRLTLSLSVARRSLPRISQRPC